MSKAKQKAIDPEVVQDDSWQDRHTTVPAVQQQSALTPMTLIEKALSQGAGIEQLERLYDLQVKYEQDQAKKAYFKAFAAFKSEAVEIIKDKKVGFDTSQGRTEYSHASLGNVISTITPALSRHGLSLNWDTVQDAGSITVTCTLTHELGFSQSTQMSASKDDSGKKNQIQQVASTQTYLQRYTALAITGLATKDQDNDGRGSEGSEDEEVEVISDEEYANIDALLAELDLPVGPLLSYFKIDSLEYLPAEHYNLAIQKLEKQRVK